ncbi:hypothetical protein [Micromonospora sp. NPDC126480]|uniref:hypothetical protein n=1 Tax=Micromonospora sp. NPDC126480 TaxID=3155312 RepID=UPI0033234DD6
MTAPGRVLRVTVLADQDADDQDLAVLAEGLRAEVLESEFDLVGEPAPAPLPPGAKAADPAGVTSLLIALAASGGVLTGLIGLLQAWLLRGSDRTLVVEIDGDRLELTGATSEERRRLTNAWLSRHEQVAGTPPSSGAASP